MIARFAFLLLIALVGCSERPVPPSTRGNAAPATPAPAPALDGAALVERFQCARCHSALGATPVERSCVRCHDEILAGTFEADPSDLRRWQRSIHTFVDVPSLASHATLDRAFVRTMLLAPTDQRPGLEATMPRLAVTEAEAVAIAEHLVPGTRALAVPNGDAARGESLYRSSGCASCHALGTYAPLDDSIVTSVPVSAADRERGRRRAPDLALARVRRSPGALMQILVDPRVLAPDTPMPSYGFDAAAANDLVAFLVSVPLRASTPASVPTYADLPRWTSPVDYDELEVRVFRRSCWHCHADADFAYGEGGAGNTGGFGFRPRGIELASSTGLHSGYLRDDGTRRSLFEPMPDGTPRLVAALLARHAEVAGAPVPGIRGMPLAMPPLPLDEIARVDAYVRAHRAARPVTP